MPRPKLFELQAWQSTDLPVQAYIVDHAGVALLQSSVASIAYIVKNAAGTTTSSGTLTVSEVIFDVLQAWTEDAVGCNFKGTIPAAAFPAAGNHQLQIKFTLTSGSPTYLRATVGAQGVFTS